jgi:hypothetical protein
MEDAEQGGQEFLGVLEETDVRSVNRDYLHLRKFLLPPVGRAIVV